jgi:hypothetical protein
MAHGSSVHQAYTVNRLEHDGKRAVKRVRLSTCRIILEEIKEMIIIV